MDDIPEQPPKVLTVQDANALLPDVTDIVKQLQALQHSIITTNAQIEEATKKVSSGNGHPIEALKQQIQQLTTHQMQLIESFNSSLQQLQALGAWLKDLEMGLVDFYGMRDGDYVWLCWKLGEPKVAYWHGLEDGFTGRQPL